MYLKVSYEVDRRSKFRFYMHVLFDFLDITVLNSKVVSNKIQSSVALSTVDFQFSLARSMLGNFGTGKRAIPTSRPSKEIKSENVVVVHHLPQFPATCARCAYVLQKSLRATHLFVV